MGSVSCIAKQIDIYNTNESQKPYYNTNKSQKSYYNEYDFNQVGVNYRKNISLSNQRTRYYTSKSRKNSIIK